jgi:hypothetical protein
MRSLYVHVDAGEAVFVPTDDFMRATPLWRLDVLGDIAQAVERTQQHAAVDYVRRLNQRRPGLTMDQRLAAFRRVCDEGGVVQLRVFEHLKDSNTILYSTHLASMVDLDFPERVRIVEAMGTHAVVKQGVVSSQRAPRAVMAMPLGLTGNMAGLLSNRRTLIVEGGDDALLINKLSAVLRRSDMKGLSDSIYLWPAQGAPKTPMYAAFAIGQGWDSGVLLDSDLAGNQAKKKIEDLYLEDLAKDKQQRFRVFQIGAAAKIKKTDAAIEELFTDEYYVDMTKTAYGVKIDMTELPKDGSDVITKRLEPVKKQKYGYEFDKGRVVAEMLRRFDNWREAKDLPLGTADRAAQLFKTTNAAFNVSGK